jgi:hypothetical protein
MTIEEVREFAEAVGVLMTDKYSDKNDLIRVIQLSMGGEDCFSDRTRCVNDGKCEWQEECSEKKSSDG